MQNAWAREKQISNQPGLELEAGNYELILCLSCWEQIKHFLAKSIHYHMLASTIEQPETVA